MVVIVAKNLPPAVRGRLRLYAVEPRPNVFVSGVKNALAQSLVTYLMSHCPRKSGLLIFTHKKTAPGYTMMSQGEPDREFEEICGFQMIKENPKKSKIT